MIMIRKNMYINSTFTWIGGFSGLVMQPDCKYVYHTHKTDYTFPQGFNSLIQNLLNSTIFLQL